VTKVNEPLRIIVPIKIVRLYLITEENGVHCEFRNWKR